MSWFLLGGLAVCFWVMSLSMSTKTVVTMVGVVCLLGWFMCSFSELKCYLLIFLYVGGLFITIIYISSLTFKQSASFVVYWVGIFLLLEESVVFSSGGSGSVVFSFFSLLLGYSVVLIFMSCFLMSQLLLTEKALRSLGV